MLYSAWNEYFPISKTPYNHLLHVDFSRLIIRVTKTFKLIGGNVSFLDLNLLPLGSQTFWLEAKFNPKQKFRRSHD